MSVQEEAVCQVVCGHRQKKSNLLLVIGMEDDGSFSMQVSLFVTLAPP